MNNNNILQINSSARFSDSKTRQISALVIDYLQQENSSATHTHRDVATGLPLINETWVNANFTDKEKRTKQQQESLAFSDELVNELKQAHYIVISSPLYNFGIPATLKAWIDLIARANLTFKYNKEGQPVGLLKNKKIIIIMASGGTPLNSEWDKASPYLKQVLGFIGLTDVVFIDANETTLDKNQIARQLKSLIGK